MCIYKDLHRHYLPFPHSPAQYRASPVVGVRDVLVFSSLRLFAPRCVQAEQMPVLGKVFSRGTASSILVYN